MKPLKSNSLTLIFIDNKYQMTPSSELNRMPMLQKFNSKGTRN